MGQTFSANAHSRDRDEAGRYKVRNPDNLRQTLRRKDCGMGSCRVEDEFGDADVVGWTKGKIQREEILRLEREIQRTEEANDISETNVERSQRQSAERRRKTREGKRPVREIEERDSDGEDEDVDSGVASRMSVSSREDVVEDRDREVERQEDSRNEADRRGEEGLELLAS